MSSAMCLMPLSRNPGGLSSKAMKTMGLSAQSLFENFMGAKNGILTRQEYHIFWSAISGPENSKETLLILRQFIKWFTEMSTDGSKKVPDYTMQGALNTIFFISLYLPVFPDTLVKKMIINWAGQLGEFRKDAPIAGYDLVVSVLKARLCENTDALDGLIANLHIMHSKETFQLIADESITTFQKRDFLSQSFPFIYAFILAQCKEKNTRLRVFDIILYQFQLVQAQPFSLEQQHSVLALLHLLRSMLLYWRAPTGPFLQTAIERVIPFFSWPCPYSSVARRVLLMLKQEMLAPGNSVLERFASESRVPETSQVINGEMHRSRPIFYIVDASCSLSSNFCHIINLFDADLYIDGDNKMFASGLSTEVQAMLLLNIIHSPSAPIDPNDVYKITEEDVVLLFGQTVNILQESLDISPEDAVSHRERNFALIRTQFAKIARSNESRGIVSDLSLPSTLSPSLMPSLPEIAHVHWLVSRDYIFPTAETISQLGFVPFPKTPLLDKIEKILRLYEAFADAQDPVEVRLCIAGSDSIIHQVATAYLELMTRESEPLKGIMLRFFLIPFRNSILASYIARYDSWYNRQLYVPLINRYFLVPAMSEEDPVFNDIKPDDTITPFGHLLQSNIESYVREAEYSLPVKLFQIHAWRRLSAEEGPADLVVPLVQKAEVGRVANAMLFKTASSLGTMASLRDVKEIFRDKDFSYTPFDFNVQMTRVDLFGNPNVEDQRRQSTIREEPIPFDRISIANVPSADDPTFPANPKDPWLEVFAKVSEHKAKLKNKYSFLIQEPLQHVSFLKLTSARDDQPFRIIVDGESFGPFKKIQISRVDDRSQKQLSLTIGTFFPIQS